MFKDSSNTPINVGDTVLHHGCLYIVIEFVVYELVTEVVCMDKLTRNFKSFPPRDLMKIASRG